MKQKRKDSRRLQRGDQEVPVEPIQKREEEFLMLMLRKDCYTGWSIHEKKVSPEINIESQTSSKIPLKPQD